MQQVLPPTLHRLDTSQCYMGLLLECGSLSRLSDGLKQGLTLLQCGSTEIMLRCFHKTRQHRFAFLFNMCSTWQCIIEGTPHKKSNADSVFIVAVTTCRLDLPQQK